MVNTRSDRRRDVHADDRLVYSLYYIPLDVREAWIKEHCVDNAVRLDGQLWCAQQPQVQSKVDVLSTPPVMVAEAVVQAEHWLNLASRKNSYENRSPVFSHERLPYVCLVMF